MVVAAADTYAAAAGTPPVEEQVADERTSVLLAAVDTLPATDTYAVVADVT